MLNQRTLGKRKRDESLDVEEVVYVASDDENELASEPQDESEIDTESNNEGNEGESNSEGDEESSDDKYNEVAQSNDDDGSEVEEEDLTSDVILKWLENGCEPDLDNDIPDLDYSQIVDRATPEVIDEVIISILHEYVSSADVNSLNALKEFSEVIQTPLTEFDALDNCLETAVNKHDLAAAEFFHNNGASSTLAIQAAIYDGSDDMLQLLEIKVEEELVTYAAENECISAINYFLTADFGVSSEIILRVAAEKIDRKQLDFVDKSASQNSIKLIKTLLDHSDSEIDNAYDFIKCIIDNNGNELIYLFINHFGPEPLLTELYEQDKGGEVFELVLAAVMANITTSRMDLDEINTLVASFSKFKIEDSLLFYPCDFNGYPKLANLRQSIDESGWLSDEARIAANLIGIALSPSANFFQKSPMHAFELKDTDTYRRGTKTSVTKAVGRKNTIYKPDPSTTESKKDPGFGRAAHLGLYENEFDALNKSRAISLLPRTGLKVASDGKSDIYDSLLEYRRNTCSYIIDKFEYNKKFDSIKPHAYHNYPCLMVFIKKPATEIKLSDATLESWTQLIISFYIGLVNHKAYKMGLDIELVRRSSFGAIVPTVAACGRSFRINVGIIPNDYANILVECLNILSKTLTMFNLPPTELTSKDMNIRLSPDCFLQSSEYKNYISKSKKKPPKIDTILDLMWSPVDTNGHTGVYNLGHRSASARYEFTADVHNLIENNKPKSSKDHAQILLAALRQGFNKFSINKGSLRFKQDAPKFLPIAGIEKRKEIQDQNFFSFISSSFLLAFQREQQIDPNAILDEFEKMTLNLINSSIKNNIVGVIYYQIQVLLELFFVRSILTRLDTDEDLYGSDSDIEDEPEQNPTVFGKKMIVRNGVRAILTSVHASTAHLGSGKKSNLYLDKDFYYEIEKSLKLLGYTFVDEMRNADVIIYDINTCITEGRKPSKFNKNELSSTKVLILDNTSATTREHLIWYQLFKKNPAMQILIFASSGFKNEQMGADKNAYGTVRIFTKSKTVLANIMSFIRKSNEPIKSTISHRYRRAMKRSGNTLRNQTIIGSKDKASTEYLTSSSLIRTSQLPFSSLQPSAAASTKKDKPEQKVAPTLHPNPLWYDSDKIKKLLHILISSKSDIEIFDPIDCMQCRGDTLRENLIDQQIQQALVLSTGNRLKSTYLMPINLRNMHWAALYIHFPSENRLKPTIRYFDPYGTSITPVEIASAFTSVYTDLTPDDITAIPIPLQDDGINCGPWIVTIFEHLVNRGVLPPEDYSIEARRREHNTILQTGRNIQGINEKEQSLTYSASHSLFPATVKIHAQKLSGETKNSNIKVSH